MKKIVLLPTLLLLYVAVYAEPPRDWAQYGRYERQNAELAGRPVEAVFMGNSITDHWINLHPDFFEENGFVDRGISGQTTIEMLARFRSDVIELRPKVVVILAGINDIAQNNGPIKLEDTFRNIVSMCDLARYNGIRVVLCSVLPCDRFSWRPQIQPGPLVRELNAMLKRYADEQQIAYVDYHTAFDNGNGGLTERFAADGCHPTHYGYSLMEPLVVEGINKTLKTSKARYTSPIPNE
ncbi:GDSL-type esterase/lipase family protein [uncultured Alistipes sp.]|jgi:lipolytic enzyme, G-D-S-L|uniref:GDSL-type esterase/lipase family protein n=1 Tax=uncultured Alistipes sp. TaxID=538949 RepID=UPI0025F7ED6F|nr:GDSL-type esterase/lipase family protein [uncultured Alistipes sp.]